MPANIGIDMGGGGWFCSSLFRGGGGGAGEWEVNAAFRLCSHALL